MISLSPDDRHSAGQILTNNFQNFRHIIDNANNSLPFVQPIFDVNPLTFNCQMK